MRLSAFTTFEDGAEALTYARDNEGAVVHFEENERVYGYVSWRLYFILYWKGERYNMVSIVPEKKQGKKDTDEVRRSFKSVCAGELRRIAEKYNGRKIEQEDGEPITIPSFELFVRGYPEILRVI